MTTVTSPFHAGEQTIQHLAGVRDRVERKGRAVIRDYMPEQHREFFAALMFMVVGMADQNGHPWATTLSGPSGFMNSAEANLLTIKAWLDPDDPLHSCIRDGAPIGGLGIDFSTRRRNRINGRIENCVIGEGFSIRVQQSFGNCQKYIQARNERPRLRSKPVPESRMASHLGDSEASFVAEADTRAGLLFIDFRSGGMLHIIGRTKICWDVPVTTRSAGVERLIFLDIQCVLNREHSFPHLYDFVSYSPHLGAEG